MKRILLLLTLAGCAGPAARDESAKAPEFEVTQIDHTPVKGATLWQNRPVLLVFMTSWCGTCRSEVPLLNRLSERHSIAAIATGDTAETVARFRRQTGAVYPVLLDDGRAAKAFDVVSSPTCIRVETDGTISYRGTEPPEGMR